MPADDHPLAPGTSAAFAFSRGDAAAIVDPAELDQSDARGIASDHAAATSRLRALMIAAMIFSVAAGLAGGIASESVWPLAVGVVVAHAAFAAHVSRSGRAFVEAARARAVRGPLAELLLDRLESTPAFDRPRLPVRATDLDKQARLMRQPLNERERALLDDVPLDDAAAHRVAAAVKSPRRLAAFGTIAGWATFACLVAYRASSPGGLIQHATDLGSTVSLVFATQASSWRDNAIKRTLVRLGFPESRVAALAARLARVGRWGFTRSVDDERALTQPRAPGELLPHA